MLICHFHITPPIREGSSTFAKRAFDLSLAGLAVILATPVMALIAIAIKLDDGGPVIFRQQRVGRHGVPFGIHKFRSMREDAPLAGPQITIGADPRITRVGGWLRRLSLDERAVRQWHDEVDALLQRCEAAFPVRPLGL